MFLVFQPHGAEPCRLAQWGWHSVTASDVPPQSVPSNCSYQCVPVALTWLSSKFSSVWLGPSSVFSFSSSGCCHKCSSNQCQYKSLQFWGCGVRPLACRRKKHPRTPLSFPFQLLLLLCRKLWGDEPGGDPAIRAPGLQPQHIRNALECFVLRSLCISQRG